MQIDELITFLAFLFWFLSIARRIWITLLAPSGSARPKLRGDELSLLMTVFPVFVLTAYFGLLILHLPAFEQNIPLRQAIIRPAFVALGLNFGIYFMNGWLSDVFTYFLTRVTQWTQFSPRRFW